MKSEQPVVTFDTAATLKQRNRVDVGSQPGVSSVT